MPAARAREHGHKHRTARTSVFSIAVRVAQLIAGQVNEGVALVEECRRHVDVLERLGKRVVRRYPGAAVEAIFHLLQVVGEPIDGVYRCLACTRSHRK